MDANHLVTQRASCVATSRVAAWLAVTSLALLMALTGSVSVGIATAQEAAPVGEVHGRELELAEEQAFRTAAVLVGPSLVRIETVGGLDEVDGILAVGGATTGVVIGEDGLIVTSAFHFMNKPTSILVTLADGRKFPAQLVATDYLRMLALLKIEADNLPVPQMAALDGVEVGAWAIALGKSLSATEPSISVGVISAKGRVWGKALQTDAKISPVNYGGPLLDVNGQMTGLLVPLSPQSQTVSGGYEWYDSGIGFAIPSADVHDAVARMKSGENLRPGLMGAAFAANDLSGNPPVIEHVRFQSPAAEAGLKVNDVLVSADGIALPRLGSFKHVIGRKYAGDSLSLVVKRGEEEIPLQLKLVDVLPPWDEPVAGFLLRPAEAAPAESSTPKENEKADAPAKNNALIVRAVYADSPAAKAGMQRDDEILSAQQVAISTPDDLRKVFDQQKPGQTIELEVRRQGADQPVKLSIALAGQPMTSPTELPTLTIETNPDQPKAAYQGRFLSKLAANQREFWGYAPPSVASQVPHGLILWMHPQGNSMEAAVLKSLKAACDRRQLVLIGPKAEQGGWTPEDVDFVKAVVEEMRQKLPIDPTRIVIMGHGDSTKIASFLAFKDPSTYRGVILSGGLPAGNPPEREPTRRTQMHVTTFNDSRVTENIQKLLETLATQKMAVQTEKVSGDGSEFPDEAWGEKLGLWLDQLNHF